MASGPRVLKPPISDGPVLNVAVIGCGEVSQVVHVGSANAASRTN